MSAATKQRSPIETCSACAGSGMQLNSYHGEPETCWECGGMGTVRARDKRGRFIPYPKDEATK